MRTYGWYGDLCVVLPILLTLVSLKRELSQKSSHVLFSPYFLTLVSLKRELSQRSSHVLFSPYFLTLVSLKLELSYGALGY